MAASSVVCRGHPAVGLSAALGPCARLFISAKTVEHHVSRMRHRLGASGRSDLLARLRMEVAEG